LRSNYRGFTGGGGGTVRDGIAPLDEVAPDGGDVSDGVVPDGGVDAVGNASFGTVYVVGV
jgi:hypothetical protein